MKRSFFGEMWARVKAESPSFFKKIKLFGLALSACGATISTIKGVPAMLTDISSHFMWVGAVIAAVASLVVKNPEDLVKKVKPEDIVDDKQIT